MAHDSIREIAAETLAGEESIERQLTVDEAVSLAILLQKDGQLEAAEIMYSRILAAAPEHPAALHYAGVLAQQMDRHEQAVTMIAKSLDLVPDSAEWHSNFGIALQSHGDFDEATAAYRRAIALDPHQANAYSNLGVVLRATDKPVEAEAAYREAIRLDANHIDAYTNLGILLNALKRSDEAVACFCKVILLRPKHREARRLLALAHCKLGDVAEAIKIFEEWLREEPGDPIATHMLAACTGNAIPARASDGFVANTFDSFAESFESKLAKLHYRAPKLVAAMVDDAGLPAAKTLDVLDAGCGTGLCGPLIAKYARRLVGVDLSSKMVAQAAEKKVYDELLTEELTEYLLERPAAFDIIVSADTLVYFGVLEDVIAAGASALRPGGVLVFTLEHAVGEAARDYRLELHGRYSHSRAYVERLLAAAGLTHDIVEAELRMESGTPVAGLVVQGTKPIAAVNRG